MEIITAGANTNNNNKNENSKLKFEIDSKKILIKLFLPWRRISTAFKREEQFELALNVLKSVQFQGKQIKDLQFIDLDSKSQIFPRPDTTIADFIDIQLASIGKISLHVQTTTSADSYDLDVEILNFGMDYNKDRIKNKNIGMREGEKKKTKKTKIEKTKKLKKKTRKKTRKSSKNQVFRAHFEHRRQDYSS